MTSPRRTWRRRLSTAAAASLTVALIAAGGLSASAASYPRISGNGSSWAGAAIEQWRADVAAQGVTIDYTNDGSSSGRKNFAQEISDFAVSEIPYDGDTADPQDTARPNSPYAMMPIVAGGTSFMYNLPVNGKRFDDLKLSQAAIAGIFTGGITRWNDPAISVDNPGVNLPDNQITVVVRSDGSGATAQFTLWMKRVFPEQYAALCARAGCDPGHATSYFPSQGLSNFVGQSQSNGVTTYTSTTDYTINYDEYAYPLGLGFPVAKVKNAAGFYTIPTAPAVAVALTQAVINTDTSSANYLSQDLSNVYGYGDPRSYPMSAYSYLLVPAAERGLFNAAKGSTLAYYANYALCEGQQKMGDLGYSPLPMNLVLAALEQVRKIPGVDASTAASMDATTTGVLSGGSNPCNNPTFKPGDSPSSNHLVQTAPFDAGCDAACQAPWTGVLVSASGPQFGGATAPAAAGTAAGAGAAAGAAVGLAGEQVCDVNTGICTDAETTVAGGKVTQVSTVIGGVNGWAGPQTLMIIVFLLATLLILGPPLMNRVLGAKRGPTGRDSA